MSQLETITRQEAAATSMRGTVDVYRSDAHVSYTGVEKTPPLFNPPAQQSQPNLQQKPLLPPPPKKTIHQHIPDTYRGSQGESIGKANHIIDLNTGDRLNVHAPKGIITGAKINDNPINNYEAAMYHLVPGTTHKNTGGQW